MTTCEICGGLMPGLPVNPQKGEYPCSCADQPQVNMMVALREILRRMERIERATNPTIGVIRSDGRKPLFDTSYNPAAATLRRQLEKPA